MIFSLLKFSKRNKFCIIKNVILFILIIFLNTFFLNLVLAFPSESKFNNVPETPPREKQLRERREEEERRLADSTENIHSQIPFSSLNKPSEETP
ncbi:hypothetical protein, partial [Candidatus Phytoplasma stylosanthis]|uniref:hypothetical protein n=1 Tax=Candidatus Phytoplasma stylosanthis TaxID=2798314 RepID=UPI00298DC91A